MRVFLIHPSDWGNGGAPSEDVPREEPFLVLISEDVPEAGWGGAYIKDFATCSEALAGVAQARLMLRKEAQG